MEVVENLSALEVAATENPIPKDGAGVYPAPEGVASDDPARVGSASFDPTPEGLRAGSPSHTSMDIVGTLNQGYPLLQHEDIAPMRGLLTTRRTAPDPTGWVGQRAPRGKERHHTPVSPDPHRRTLDPYIHTSPEPPGRSKLQQDPGTRRTLMCAGVRC
jgi:hypothetical protein